MNSHYGQKHGFVTDPQQYFLTLRNPFRFGLVDEIHGGLLQSHSPKCTYKLRGCKYALAHAREHTILDVHVDCQQTIKGSVRARQFRALPI